MFTTFPLSRLAKKMDSSYASVMLRTGDKSEAPTHWQTDFHAHILLQP